jgi:uncharacterized delta-60 repeat protein
VKSRHHLPSSLIFHPFFVTCAVALCWCLTVASFAHAAPGDLDLSFGSNGKVTTHIGRFDSTHAPAIQSDGKLVVAGSVGSGFPDFGLVRYNSDGSLDTSFGNGGIVTTDITNYRNSAYALAIQSDGKLVVGGLAQFNGGTPDIGLVRYNSDGSLDATFGNGGKVMTDFGEHDQANEIAIQSDDKLVVAGYINGTGALVRYHADGTLDATFGSGGKVMTDISTEAFIIQSDGKLVIGGSAQSTPGGNYDFGLVRYHADGTLDTTFGSGGKVITNFSST